MPIYRAPVEDFRFLFNELLELEKHRDLPGFADLSPDLIDDILTNAGKFCEEVLQPLNQSGDEEGCHFENGMVRTPKGFKEAYKAYSEAGWGGLGAPEEHGGAGMPPIITMAVSEMGMSANQSLAMYPMLTAGAYGALLATGADWMKQHIVPKMVSGEWAGTMCLTEPGCRHRPAPDEDQGGGAARRHLHDERHQDLHLRRRPGPDRQHHPHGDRQDSGRERPDP